MRRYRRRSFDQIRAEERLRLAKYMERYAARIGERPATGVAATVLALASNLRADICEPETGWPQLPLERDQ